MPQPAVPPSITPHTSRKRKSSELPLLSSCSAKARDSNTDPGSKRRRKQDTSGRSSQGGTASTGAAARRRHHHRSSQGAEPPSSSSSNHTSSLSDPEPSSINSNKSSSSSSSDSQHQNLTDSETAAAAAKRTSRNASPKSTDSQIQADLLSKLQTFSGEGSDMGNCVGKKASLIHNAPGAGKGGVPQGDDKAVVEALTRSPERSVQSPCGLSSDEEGDASDSAKADHPQSPQGKHGSRRRLSLIHAAPITHKSEDGPRGTAQIIPKRPTEQRLSLEGVLSKDGAGTRVSIMGAAAHTHQKNFEDKNETCRGNVTGETLITMGIGHACRKGLKPESPNQDDFFIIRIENIGLYGVFDGHGPFGHDISNFVQQNLPKLIYNHAEFYTNPKNTLRMAFQKVQEDIEKACDRRDFDAALSGCTATVIIHDIEKKRLYVAHVGDSRAVLAQRRNDGQISAIDLTQDHKPTLEGEKARIEAKGGEVKRLEGDIPYRVFLKDKMYPGLAMSRALGDLVAGQAGVSPEPDITEWKIEQNKDLFIVLCSDGVWEFISSQESVDLVARHGQKEVQTAADALARESWNKWIVEEGDVVDDITVEVIYLF